MGMRQGELKRVHKIFHLFFCVMQLMQCGCPGNPGRIARRHVEVAPKSDRGRVNWGSMEGLNVTDRLQSQESATSSHAQVCRLLANSWS